MVGYSNIYTTISVQELFLFTELTKILDKCRGFYENTVILGDFKMQPTNQILETFLIGIWSWRKQFKTHTKLSSPKTTKSKGWLVLQ